MDGLPGLENIFKEEFQKTKVQQGQVHVARNVLAKVAKNLKQAIADDSNEQTDLLSGVINY